MYTHPVMALLFSTNSQLSLNIFSVFETLTLWTCWLMSSPQIQVHKHKGLLYSHYFTCLRWMLAAFLSWGFGMRRRPHQSQRLSFLCVWSCKERHLPLNSNEKLVTVTQHFWEQTAVCSEGTFSPQLRAKQGLQSVLCERGDCSTGVWIWKN